jgi:tight adherence protein C
LADALEDVAYRTRSASVQRFVDGIVVAVDRGTPIADVLRAQAMDARDAGHRALMESAGKREIYALVPVVFLILPVVVVVAVFPGFYGLVL